MSHKMSHELPPIDILLVEDRVRMAQQLARLLQTWGAASAHVAPSVGEALSLLDGRPLPSLLLLDHRLGDGPGCVVALWLALRPALRQGTQVAVYTNSDRYEVTQSLSALVAELGQPGIRSDQILGTLSPEERTAAEERLALVRGSKEAEDTLFDQVYDAYFSKRLSIEEFRVGLIQLCRAA